MAEENTTITPAVAKETLPASDAANTAATQEIESLSKSVYEKILDQAEIQFDKRFDVSKLPTFSLNENGEITATSPSNTTNTTAGASTPNEPLPREINEYKISWNRRLHGANIDVLETLEKINFKGSKFGASHMEMNIAYLAYWKRGNIGTKSTIDAPNDTNPTEGDKTSEDCKKGWANCPNIITDIDINSIGTLTTSSFPFPNTDFVINPTDYLSIDDYEISDFYRYPSVSDNASQFSSTQPPESSNPLDVFYGPDDLTFESLNQDNLTKKAELSKDRYKYYFDYSDGEYEAVENKFTVFIEYYKDDPYITDERRLQEIERIFEETRLRIKNRRDDPDAQLRAQRLLQGIYDNSRNLILKNYKENKDDDDFRPAPVPSDFLDIKNSINDTLFLFRLELKDNYKDVINLERNNSNIDRITTIDTSLENVKKLEKTILSNLKSPNAEQKGEIVNILRQITSVHQEYFDAINQSGVEGIEVIPFDPRNPPDPDLYSSDPSDENIISSENATTVLDTLPPAYDPLAKNYDCQKKTTPVEGIWQFLYNPEDLKYSVSPQYVQANTWGNSEGNALHWSGNDNEKLSFSKIILNGYMFGRKVETLIKGIRDLVNVKEGGSKQSPPVLEFIFGKKYFGPCVMENITFTETMWDGGEAVAAELSFDLRKIPDWIVNDGYVSIFDPTGQPVLTAPVRITPDPDPTESADGTNGTDSSDGSTSPSDTNSNGNTNGTNTPQISDLDCRAMIDVIQRLIVNYTYGLKINLEKYTIEKRQQLPVTGGNDYLIQINSATDNLIAYLKGYSIKKESRPQKTNRAVKEYLVKIFNEYILKLEGYQKKIKGGVNSFNASDSFGMEESLTNELENKLINVYNLKCNKKIALQTSSAQRNGQKISTSIQDPNSNFNKCKKLDLLYKQIQRPNFKFTNLKGDNSPMKFVEEITISSGNTTKEILNLFMQGKPIGGLNIGGINIRGLPSAVEPTFIKVKGTYKCYNGDPINSNTYIDKLKVVNEIKCINTLRKIIKNAMEGIPCPQVS